MRCQRPEIVEERVHDTQFGPHLPWAADITDITGAGLVDGATQIQGHSDAVGARSEETQMTF